MYSDKEKKRAPWALIGVIAAVILVCAVLFGSRIPGRNLNEEAAASVKSAVERAALQCYVVEGAYPPNLEYLTDRYGLSVNTDDFYIRYDAFASNLPPDVRVERKNRGEAKR